MQDTWIGVDESGKGDYFGPLVAAAVLVRPSQVETLREIGVRDCKTLSDARVAALAPKIKHLCPYTVVTIGPEKYNVLYAKLKNLNRLLAWAHARAIENILEKEECSRALSDQFGDSKWIQNALMNKGRTITVEQRPKAEEDPAVASASVLSRHEFLMRLEQLSRKYGLELPKGSTHVLPQAKEWVKRYGMARLGEVAKVHFKITGQLA